MSDSEFIKSTSSSTWVDACTLAEASQYRCLAVCATYQNDGQPLTTAQLYACTLIPLSLLSMVSQVSAEHTDSGTTWSASVRISGDKVQICKTNNSVTTRHCILVGVK